MIVRIAVCLLLALLLYGACNAPGSSADAAQAPKPTETPVAQPEPMEPPVAWVPVEAPVEVGRFFAYLDALVARFDSLTAYPLSEHLLLRANPWILDTLVRTDYYYRQSVGEFVYDQKKMVVLHPGDTLRIPGPQTAARLLERMADTYLDVNIPAFEMRIYEGDSLMHAFPVRVGKRQTKFLQMAGNMVDLRTRSGEGHIMRVNRYPVFYDPVTGRQFKSTRRDDGKVTLMPQIPWIEPVINGMRYGQLIHPTTNPSTLGRAASNGCIGVSEADGWRVYFYAPVGCRIRIRYELEEIGPQGDTLRYPDVYHLKKAGRGQRASLAASVGDAQTPEALRGRCWCDEEAR